MRNLSRTLVWLLADAIAIPASAQEPAASPRVTYIHAGALLDRPGRTARGRSTIVIREDKIAEVREGFAAPEPGARLVDLSRQFVLPGLIDSHVHITMEVGPAFQQQLSQDDTADWAVSGVTFAERTLQAGFTTVRDLASPGRTAAAIRDGINAGRIAGPTILAAGQLISVTAGHGDVVGFSEGAAEGMRAGHYGLACDGVEDCRRAVRLQIAAGADLIKIATTGGVLSNVAGGLGQQMEPDEIAAIVSAAHRFGRRVAAHAHANAGIQAALRAGVDSVEHGTFVDASSIALFRSSNTYLVPTLLAPATGAEMARSGRLPPASAAKALEASAAAFENIRRAIGSGVRIAFGTDTFRHGNNGREFALLVQVGLSPAQAIQTATVNAADLLGRSASIGTIEPGKDADIIAVAASPLEDVTQLERVQFVMRQGIVHRIDGQRQPFNSR